MKIKKFVKEHKGELLVLAGTACLAALGGYAFANYTRDRWFKTDEAKTVLGFFDYVADYVEGSNVARGYKIVDETVKLKDVGEVLAKGVGELSEDALNETVNGVIIFAKK